MNEKRDKDVALVFALYNEGKVHGIQDALQRAWELGENSGYDVGFEEGYEDATKERKFL